MLVASTLTAPKPSVTPRRVPAVPRRPSPPRLLSPDAQPHLGGRTSIRRHPLRLLSADRPHTLLLLTSTETYLTHPRHPFLVPNSGPTRRHLDTALRLPSRLCQVQLPQLSQPTPSPPLHAQSDLPSPCCLLPARRTRCPGLSRRHRRRIGLPCPHSRWARPPPLQPPGRHHHCRRPRRLHRTCLHLHIRPTRRRRARAPRQRPCRLGPVQAHPACPTWRRLPRLALPSTPHPVLAWPPRTSSSLPLRRATSSPT